jgi:hypothetical protein
MPTTADANGNPDSFFITKVRRLIRDQPVLFPDAPKTDGAAGAPFGVAGSKSFRLQRAPVVKAFTPLLTSPAPAPQGVATLPGTGPTYFVVFDPGFPGAAPAYTASGAGTFAAGNYLFVTTFVQSGVESLGTVPFTLAIGASGSVNIGALSGLATTITAVKTYLVSANVNSINAALIATQVPAGGATTLVNVANPPGSPGTLPAFVNSDTGETFFLYPPASGGTVQLSYQAARFSDQEITDSLYEGLYLLFPEIWQPQTDITLAYSPTVTEYTLPSVFNDPDVILYGVEMQPPSGILISIETGMWRRVGLTTLVMSRGWPSGSIFRLTYNAPYLALSDLEVELSPAPTYYAAARLAADMETARSRQNDLVALTGEGGSQTGTGASLVQLWTTLFTNYKNQRKREQPRRSILPDRSVELLDSRSEFVWDPV